MKESGQPWNIPTDDQHIGEVEEQGYRYLGILQLDQTLNIKIKRVTIPDGSHLIHEIKFNKL